MYYDFKMEQPITVTIHIAHFPWYVQRYQLNAQKRVLSKKRQIHRQYLRPKALAIVYDQGDGATNYRRASL